MDIGKRRRRRIPGELIRSATWMASYWVPRWMWMACDFLGGRRWRKSGAQESSQVLNMQPVTFLIPSSDYDDTRWRILHYLQRATKISTRVRAGIIVPSGSDVKFAKFTQYVVDAGRQMISHTTQAAGGRESWLLKDLIRSLSKEFGGRDPTPRELLLSPLETMSFSHLPGPVLAKLLRLRRVRKTTIYVARFDPYNPLHRQYLWDRLPLKSLIHRGEWFQELEDSPEFNLMSDPPAIVVDASYRREPGTHGLFSEFGEEIYFEEGKRPEEIPASLPELDAAISLGRTPVVRVANILPVSRTTRTSTRDDHASPAAINLPGYGLRYPDPWDALLKVRTYCLDPNQTDQKWVGFRAAGFERVRLDDDFLLAALICSGLLYGFQVRDARATADGKVQFGVQIALPTRRGGLMELTTSWWFDSTAGPQLSTAFLGGSGAGALAPVLHLPETAHKDFAELFDYVQVASSTYSERMQSDGLIAYGVIWIRHDHHRSKQFAAWLRHTSAGSSMGVFTRRRLGGRVTGWRLNSIDATSTEARLRFAQYALMLAGVRTHPELMFD